MVWNFGRIFFFWTGWSFLPSDSIPFWKRPLEPPNHVFSNSPPHISTCPLPPPKKGTTHSFHQKQKRCKLRSIAISFVTPWGAPAVSHYEDLPLSQRRQRQPKNRTRLRCRFSHPKKIIRLFRDDVLAINLWNIFEQKVFFIFNFYMSCSRSSTSKRCMTIRDLQALDLHRFPSLQDFNDSNYFFFPAPWGKK